MRARPSRHRRRHTWRSLSLALLGAFAMAAVQREPASPEVAPTADQRIVVRTRAGATAQVAVSARSLGARDVELIPFIDAFSTTAPTLAVDRLRRDPAVVSVAADAAMTVQGAVAGSSAWPQSKYVGAIGADVAHRDGVTGRGAVVALVDTGVTPHADLRGRLVAVTDDLTGEVDPCVDFSGESSCRDGYGHGTFLAGIIAGSGAASGGKRVGVAPGAKILSVKVAGRDGATDVSTVLSAIQWVVSFKDRYDISVLNLSLGTDSTTSTTKDPLNYAVERAWESGIVVVVAASNRGPSAKTISKPADDPFVITVGAVDDRGTVPIRDDRLPLFSSRGPTLTDGWAKPDVAAPGAHIVSLRSRGSEIDRRYPGTIDRSYRRGSGTSMSAAVVSGTVALALQARPTATPDEIKYALVATARRAASDDPMAVGTGEISARAMVSRTAPTGTANVGAQRSSGLGELDPSRGTVRVLVQAPVPTVLTGTLTAQLLLWDSAGFVTGDWSAETWYLQPAASSRRYPMDWAGSNWGGSNWGGSNWGGSEWYGQEQPESYGSRWRGGAWYGSWE